MRRHRKHFMYALLALALLSFAGFYINRNLVMNLTPSLPRGIYKYTDQIPAKGAYVVFDLPDDSPAHRLAEKRGYVKLGRKLQKRIAAMPGESYTLPQACERDSRGRLIRRYEPVRGVVPPGMVIVLGQTPKSFDSRYFGPVPLELLRVVLPVFLIDKEITR